MVRHTDRAVARYIHLTLNGALVEVGEAVTQGQRVGLSGNSGESTAPHLHFDVQTCGPNLPPGVNNLPCGQTVPLSFRNTVPQSCGLMANTAYTAEPFTADSRQGLISPLPHPDSEPVGGKGNRDAEDWGIVLASRLQHSLAT
jgi:murein DD-endopeptidase MepM/ murein hydrolase activator NlpD